MRLLTPAWTRFKYHETQRALWDCRKRFIVVPAGRGSGKTEIAKRYLVRALSQVKDHRWRRHTRYFYAAPTQSQAMDIAWEHFQQLIPPQWIEPDGVRITPKPRIRCRFRTHRADLYVVGLDQPQRIEGPQWDGAVVDECSDTKPSAFKLNIMPALYRRSGWLMRTGVPKRKGVGAAAYRKFFEDARDGKIDNAAAFTWPSSDIVPEDVLKDARQQLDPRDYNEQFNASWETAGGAVFYAFDRRLNVRVCKYDRTQPLMVGSDFNVNPMAWVIFQVRKGGIMEVIDEIFIRDTNTQATLDLLWSKWEHHRSGFHFYGDPAGRQRQTSASASDYIQIMNDPRFMKAGRSVHYRKAAPPVEDRFAACNALFCNAAGDRRFFVDPSCEHLIRDLEMRTRESKKEDADMTHSTDALGYAIHFLFPIRLFRGNTDDQNIIGFRAEEFAHA
jgi:hypothetical protein